MDSYYKPGAWNVICDRCGFEFKNDELKVEEHTNYRVCSKCLDVENPQQHIRIRKERITPPWTRPEERFAADITASGNINWVTTYPLHAVTVDCTSGNITLGFTAATHSIADLGTLFQIIRVDNTANTLTVTVSPNTWVVPALGTLRLKLAYFSGGSLASPVWELIKNG